MNFDHSPKVQELCRRLTCFMDDHIIPRIRQHHDDIAAGIFPVSFVDDLKQLAKSEGLWNLFLPDLKADEGGAGLTNLDYAPLAEIMGRVSWAAEIFNCSAPDTGNMEILHMFGTGAQKKHWLAPLLAGKIRSAFAMTEPDVSSSDATNIQTIIRRDNANYIINGRKWFISNAAHPNCKVMIVMGKTDPDNADRHRQQSMILVPMDSAGVTVERNIPIMHHHSPEGHCEITFRDVCVPTGNILGGEGDGFMMAQARLGPGRIHHCMRSIGQSELALDLMVERALERKAFGKYLHQHGAVSEWIARSRMEIDQARLLVLKTADMIDKVGAKSAAKEISMIKAVVPKMQTVIADRAMQVFGAMGISPDTPLADIWTWGRALRYADGPDEVHLRTIARLEIGESRNSPGATLPYLTPPLRT
ncbi:MAG: acyl-CoA dehydrogenase [Alphaproteobacteria bacterium]|nr:acyl-CoA dehydrogenase [Alphaproteobacteria bacterium]